MAIEMNRFIMYLNNGNYENDFEMFLEDLLDDKEYTTITKDECGRIVVNEQIFIVFNEKLKNKNFNFSNIIFNKEVIFQNNHDEGLSFSFENTYFKKLNIAECEIDDIIFNGEINNIEELNISNCKLAWITINSNIQGNFNFKKCIFGDFNKYNSGNNIDFRANFAFDFCEINNMADFTNFHFKNKVSFKMSKFKDNVYFNNSHFYDYVDFHECEFEKMASFYGVTFEKAPNFSQAIFKGNLNAVNANLNFDFENLKEKINQECKEFNKNKKEKDKKSLDKFANDFRDSFRVFKNVLIKDNNLLDASNFHKYELYCKEIELKQSWNKLKNVMTDEDIKQNNRNHSQLVDFLLLGFYRKLCDHHTNLLRVFNNLILLIALYALFIFGFTWLHDDKLKDTRAILTLFGFFDKFEFYFNIGVVVCMSFGLILIGKNFIKSFLSILKIFQCLPYIKKWLLKVFKNEIFIKLFSRLKIIILDLCYLMESLVIALLIPCVFYILFVIFGFFLNLDQDFKYLLFINSLFVSSYICLVYTKSLFFGRYVILILSYVVFFIMLINQPSIIHPLIGKIMGDFDKNLSYPSLLTLNILYTILMALVLFSLQKTARKNSIVPN